MLNHTLQADLYFFSRIEKRAYPLEELSDRHDDHVIYTMFARFVRKFLIAGSRVQLM